jgi:hypothetical protein
MRMKIPAAMLRPPIIIGGIENPPKIMTPVKIKNIESKIIPMFLVIVIVPP